MCSFTILSKIFDNRNVNNKVKNRGPDFTNKVEYNNFIFYHNLLHITGKMTIQPLIKDNIVILFNGELNVLGFRLNQLNSFVDYFIIVESEKISYELNKEVFKDFEDKIIYLKIDNDPYYYQLRNFLRKILPEFEDIIFISDVGEIPDLTKLDELMEPLKYDSLILNHYHGNPSIFHHSRM